MKYRVLGRLVSAAIAVVLVGSSTSAEAHPAVDDRIHDLSHQIAADRDDPDLYLRRGDLFVEEGHFSKARADFQRAARLAPDRADVHYHRGAMWMEADRPARAVNALDRYLQVRPDHAEARFLRARALAATGRLEHAVADLEHGLAHTHRHSPEPHLMRAQLLADLERPDEALRAIDDALARFGPLVVLIELAIQIELACDRPEAALARMDALPPKVARAPHWLQRRGDLLRKTGDEMLARLTYLDARTRIESLPPARRNAPAMAKLHATLGQALGIP